MIVIDYQEGFAKHVDCDITSKVKQAVTVFSNSDLCIFTKFENGEGSAFFDRLNWHHMTDESDRTFVLQPGKCDIILHKDTYSAFNQELAEILESRSVSEVFLCGLDSDGCVMATAYDLFDASYEVKILQDACASSGGSSIDKAAKMIMRRSFGSSNVLDVDTLR